MGFNGVRKHQKIEDPRYLYWADTLGLLVWEEMPSAYRFTRTSIERLTREWTEAIERDISHPCIVAWVPFNESWGVPDLPDSPAQRHYVQALYHLTKTLDPTRPGDRQRRLGERRHRHHRHPRLRRPARSASPGATAPTRSRGCSSASGPAGGCCCSKGSAQEQPIMLTEFGGIAFSRAGATGWGYSRVGNRGGFRQALPAPAAGGALAAHAWPASATRSSPTPTRRPTACCTRTARRRSRSSRSRWRRAARARKRDYQIECEWRERLMNHQRQQYLVPSEDHQTANEPPR